MALSIRRGPNAGRTLVYCTCGWKHTYKTRHKADKRGAEHLKHSTPAAAKPPPNTA
jgi:hypothetical protein